MKNWKKNIALFLVLLIVYVCAHLCVCVYVCVYKTALTFSWSDLVCDTTNHSVQLLYRHWNSICVRLTHVQFPLYHPLILWLWATAFSEPQLPYICTSMNLKYPSCLPPKVDYEIQMVFCSKCLVIAIMLDIDIWCWVTILLKHIKKCCLFQFPGNCISISTTLMVSEPLFMLSSAFFKKCYDVKFKKTTVYTYSVPCCSGWISSFW